MIGPLTPEEIELYREGLRDAPSFPSAPPAAIDQLTLARLTIAEWADRCRRLLATLDAERHRYETVYVALGGSGDVVGVYLTRRAAEDALGSIGRAEWEIRRERAGTPVPGAYQRTGRAPDEGTVVEAELSDWQGLRQ